MDKKDVISNITEVLHPNLKLCFVCYHKIINTFFFFK